MRIVITTLGSFGDINPYVGLALELKARGHEPVIATSAFYRGYIEREGIGFRAVGPDVNPGDRALLARVMDARRGTEYLIRELLMPSLDEAWADLSAVAADADLLITHPVTFVGPIVARERKLPWVSTVLAPMSFFSRHDLPVFPQATWMKRLERVPGAARALVAIAKGATRAWTEPVRALAARRGVPLNGDPIFEGQHSPDLVLAMFSPLLADPQPDWPAHVRITGPVYYNGPNQDHLSDELERFLDAGSPPVVFTLGSSAVGSAGPFYEVSAEAARRAGRRAVLLVGSHAENRTAGIASNDVLLVDHAPHAALLPRAAATVHQAGIGTLHQALRAGRPMLITPFAHDQPDNAHRAARLGAARIVPLQRYTVRRVAAELDRLLSDPSVAARAADIGAAMRREDGVAAACDAIEAYAARRA